MANFKYMSQVPDSVKNCQTSTIKIFRLVNVLKKKCLDTNNIYGHLKDLQMLDKGEICDELRAIAESVGEWGNKLLEEDVFPREYYRKLLKLT